jgi:hypothetical protein
MRVFGFLLIGAALGSTQGLAQASPPNEHASDVAKTKVALHRQNPSHPAPEASETARSKFDPASATMIRGPVVTPSGRSATPATFGKGRCL